MLTPAILSFIFSAVALGFCIVNLRMFLRLSAVSEDFPPVKVSVLIPARNEERGIRETVQRVLASENVELELIVLDDSSQDRTVPIVAEIVDRDPRLSLLKGQSLPSGWCGKQFACQQLAEAATFDELVFLDADVHVDPSAIARAVAFRRRQGIDLLSGFPRQVTGTFGERLLIPLIHYILICYLPFWVMRTTTRQSAAAGCGQFFVTDKQSWLKAGGHAAIRSSMHDGIQLPRAYRQRDLRTDIFDAGDIAAVRMYVGLRQTWQGLLKNATEGVANSRLILPVTALMFCAHILPVLALLMGYAVSLSPIVLLLWATAAACSLLSRLLVCRRFERSTLNVLVHPVSIGLFLIIQWTAFLRKGLGVSCTWRGRRYSAFQEGSP